MSKNATTKNAPATTADKAQDDGKFAVIAEHAVADGKRIAAAGKRFSSLVDEVAHNVFLAYSTGYVHTARTSKDAPLPLGSIRQNEYVALFQPRDADDDSKGPSVTTITRWRRCGAALAAGIDKSDPVYRALKSGTVATDLAKVLDTNEPDEAKIRKAHALWVKEQAAAKAKASKMIESGAADEDETETDEVATRAAQVATHEAKSGEVVTVLLTIASEIDMDGLTPDEFDMVQSALAVLSAKVETYNRENAADQPVRVVS